MPTTSPDNIYFADGSTPMSAEDISAAEATSVQDALDNLINDNRQIQTFVWANSAARTAQTGMIAGDFGYQTDTGVTYRYNGSAWVAFYPGGLVPVVPTSVAGTGVSFDSTTGVVTFTAASTVSVNGCFTSSFTKYKVIMERNSSSAAVQLVINMRNAGSDDSTANYNRHVPYFTAAATAYNTASGTNWIAELVTSTSGSGEIDFSYPFGAVPTRAMGDFTGWTGTTLNHRSLPNLRHNGNTSFDGFTFTFSGGNTTGTLKVYGYN